MGFSTILSNILIGAGPFSGLTGSEAIVSFLLLIDSKIYGLFAEMYTLYIQLARAQIFDISAFDFFVNNVYVIFGVVALFILAFFLLQGMINPDDSGAGTKSIKQFVTRFVTALFLTFLVPTMFSFLYDVQDSLISWQVIPKLVLSEKGYSNPTQDVTVVYRDEEGNPLYKDDCDPSVSDDCEELTTTEQVDISGTMLNSGGYGIAYHVLNGFLYPTGSVEDVIVDASDYFNEETGFWATWGGCAVAAGGTVLAAGITAIVTYFTGGTATGFAAALTGKTGTIAAAACVAAAGIGYTVNEIGETVTAKEYSWNNAVVAMQYAGDFSSITPFSDAVVDGHMTYTPIVSTIAGLILLYMVFSFCLDLGVRAAKLVFYQIMAPISFLISTIPSKKDLMSNWFKAVMTTWLEVFIRIFCVCGVALLIRELNFDAFSGMGLIAKAIIVLGLVTFAKQFPTILGDLTGIKSGNLKLGIKEKLATGGAFAAGAIIGGGATAFARNLTNKWGNKENWKNKDGKVTAGSILKNIGGGLASASAGAASGQFRAGKAGLNAKSFADMKGAAGSGAAQAVNARDKRAAYKASHGGAWVGFETDASGKPHLTGTAFGHVSDTVSHVGEWAGIGTGDTALGYYAAAAQSSNSFNDLSESTYKKKQEYMDQNSRVKALQSQLAAAIAAGDAAREATYRSELDIEEAALKDMQRKMAAKKADVISIAATRLSVDQRTNYSNDKEFTAAYRDAILEGFKVSAADYGRSRVEKVTVTLPDGTTTERNQRILVDATGAETRMSFDDTSVLDAMLTGGEVRDEWITQDNVIQIQDAIDKANIGRQHIKTGKEREHIVRTGNRSTDKKDK
ncbi:MAG: hypothetical protein IJY87_04090 [Bacilli bacterium]|nr:hypothetical protein [Bacilli bacterium]MBQ7031487.1 hypothetical protein [Bacilli bacterium]MBQ8902232.1 hypothetical protein [Bacilli bacterium]